MAKIQDFRKMNTVTTPTNKKKVGAVPNNKNKKKTKKKSSMLLPLCLFILIAIGICIGCLTTPTFNISNITAMDGENVYLGRKWEQEIKCQYIKLNPIEIQFEKDEEKGIEIINVEAEKDNSIKFAMGKMYFEGKFKSGEEFVLDKEKGMQMMVEAEKDNPYFNLGLGTAFLFGNTKKLIESIHHQNIFLKVI